MAESRTAVALSGGGHRATLWALGALLYLADAGRNSHVTSIASVSGGSLANGALGQRVDYKNATAPEVKELVQDVGRSIAGRGTLFGWAGTWAYLLALLAGLVALALLVAEIAFAWPLDVDFPAVVDWGAIPLAVLLLLWLWAARGNVTARAFEHTLLTGERSKTLEGLHDSLDHVICATDLHAGHHAYFSSSWVCAYEFGHGGSGGLPLRRAMQASAAFPPVFPVAWIKTERFGFTGPDARGEGRFALTDGGVYDNMGDQWAHGMPGRLKRWGELPFKRADELVVVNASARLGWSSISRLRWALTGGLAPLLRDKSVLYDNGTSIRRRELVTRFDFAEKTGKGLCGALVHIEQSPYDVPRDFEHATQLWPERAQRAQAAIAALGGDSPELEEEWRQIARDNAAVKTTLVGFSPEVCARLLHHAYVLAMVNLHVIRDYPLLTPLPSRASFMELVT